MELIFGVIILVAVAYGIYFYWANRTTNTSNSTAPYKVEAKPTVEIIEFKKAEEPKGKMSKPEAAPKAKPSKNPKAKPVTKKAKAPAKAKPQVQAAGAKKPKSTKK